MSHATSAEPVVPTVQKDDVAALAAVLAAAFHSDPVGQWLAPDEVERPDALRRLFAVEIQHVTLPHGAGVTNEQRTGAALWLPPGHWKMPALTIARLLPSFMSIFGRRLPLILQGLFEVEKHHPTHEKHYYLPFVGVDPAHQGLGIGSLLLRPVLQRCDAEGEGAYLEATSPDNRRLYERHGFAVIDEVRLPSGPALWPMWRPPVPRSGQVRR